MLNNENCLVVKGQFGSRVVRRIYFRDLRGSNRMILMVDSKQYPPRYETADQEDHRKGKLFQRSIVREKLQIEFC